MNARRVLAVALTVVLCTAAGVRASAATSAHQLLPGARVTAIADRIAHALINGPDRTVAAAFPVSDQSLPAGAVALAPAGTPFVSATYVSIPIGITIDGRLARTVVAGYRVTSYVQTAVAARDLAPGAVIAADDVTLARVAANGRPAIGPDVLVGRKLNGAMPKGTPVYVEQTVANTVVKAGQTAILVVHDGPVALTADVVARTGGALGDTVTVYNARTGKAISAIVTGPNRVELTLPGGEPQ